MTARRNYAGQASFQQNAQHSEFLEVAAGHIKFMANELNVHLDNTERLTVAAGTSGFVLFGPYETYEPGEYYVTFHVTALQEGPGKPEDLVAVVDVAAAEGRKIIAKSNIFRQRSVSDGGRVDLPFELTQVEVLEFRIWSSGRAKLVIALQRPVQTDDEGLAQYCPAFRIGEKVPGEFAIRHIPHIEYAHQKGIDLVYDSSSAGLSINGINLKVKCAEDFQVLDEVFIKHDYNYALAFEHIVFDVGMNVGFASLYFANNPLVQHVYAFEPFQRPFNGAMQNIAANPHISEKITAKRIGLSDSDQDVTVKSVEGFTLGMTLNGLTHGEPETIHVRSASEALAPIIEDAKNQGWRVVVKLDCEGSEFPIFDSLTESGLLGKIDVLMIEWHKEWHPSKTQEDLIQPLTKFGFVVFDQTESASTIAGMLYAVRT